MSTTRDKRPGVLERWGDRFLGLDSPTYGDERERGVILAAYTLASTLTLYLLLGLAALLALTGAPLVGGLLVVLASVNGWTALGYASAKGVDPQELVTRATRSQRASATVPVVGLVVLWAAGTLFWVLTGHGLLPLDWTPTPAPGEATRDGAWGAVFGALGGAAVALLGLQLQKRRRAHQATAEDELD